MMYKTPKALEQAVKVAAVKSGRDTNKTTGNSSDAGNLRDPDCLDA